LFLLLLKYCLESFVKKTQMFTGIIEDSAEVMHLERENTNLTFTFKSAIANELKVDQSLAHNGVCLTVTSIELASNTYKVTAIDETLKKTNLGRLKIGNKVNIERCMPAHGRFDGHIVQGHVDETAVCTSIIDQKGSWLISFEYDQNSQNLTVEKGSICVNGVSLTVVNSQTHGFRVAIIPYTWEHTNFHELLVGSVVNLEFDILGKYMQKILNQQK
jgi:riboflavin synthase